MLRRLAALAALSVLGSCATTKEASAPSAGPKELPIPPEMQQHIEDAQDIGRVLYVYDKVSAIGTDVLMEKLGSLEGKGLGGYLAIQEANDAGKPTDVWQVQFYTRDQPPRVAYRVRVAPDKTPEFQAENPPKPIDPSGAPLFRARATAIAHLMKVAPPQQPINPVILPGAILREQGIYVYLLAGTTRPNVAVMGKHHRVLVSDDGTQVLRFEPMTKSILELPYDKVPAGAKPAAMVVSHIVTPWPLETHVFASLLHKQPIFVVAQPYLWLVDGDHITRMPPPDGQQ